MVLKVKEQGMGDTDTALPQHTAKAARLVIADDHELARAGLRSMLEGERGLHIVGEAASGTEALELCRTLRPDLALIDVRMPGMDGLETTRLIKQVCPTTSVIIVTMHENPDYLIAAMRVGAAGYLLKDTSRRELLTAVRQVLRGESFLNTELTQRLLQHLASENTAAAEHAPVRLTPRELDVLRLLAQGQTNRDIARSLVISAGTVKVHVEHIIAKLGVSDRTQAAVRAVEMNLL
jgi:DNA-binding NarL/FixJ family response regulator